MSAAIEFVRTPDSAFVDLPGYDFDTHYVQVQPGDLRMHYLDEHSEGKETVLLLHGEPSWSYLYRKMIPVFSAAGIRSVTPDLIGFGKSDKPVDRNAYTYARHVEWMHAFLNAIQLKEFTLVCQDWGGLIGLRVAAEQPGRVQRIVTANTFLPTGEESMPDAFFEWRNFSQQAKRFPIGRVIKGGCVTELPVEVVRAYDAPFPDESYKAGARAFPALVPAAPDDPAAPDNRRAWEVLRAWDKPFLTAFSDSDPITRGGDLAFRRRVPGTKGQPHTTIKGGGHFLQEDCGPELARVIVDWMQS
ncbi:MAG: haloalkane dehalogenase [Leptospiraceae bacterium]|nr:haloalkane dehalogenase [Leptospiraceae bacterium]